MAIWIISPNGDDRTWRIVHGVDMDTSHLAHSRNKLTYLWLQAIAIDLFL